MNVRKVPAASGDYLPIARSSSAPSVRPRSRSARVLSIALSRSADWSAPAWSGRCHDGGCRSATPTSAAAAATPAFLPGPSASQQAVRRRGCSRRVLRNLGDRGTEWERTGRRFAPPGVLIAARGPAGDFPRAVARRAVDPRDVTPRAGIPCGRSSAGRLVGDDALERARAPLVELEAARQRLEPHLQVLDLDAGRVISITRLCITS